MPLLRAHDLSVRLGSRPVLHGLRFEVRRGEWVGLAGPNGSGKTTLLRTIAGLLPHEGTLELDGRAVRAYGPRALARRVAFARQAQPLPFDLPALDFVLLGRAPHRGWLEPFTPADHERALAALEEVGMGEAARRPITELSGGEQQRVRLAQALAQEAEVLLLDEPTAHLDVHHQYDLMERVAALVGGGRTVIAALHDLPLAARYVSRLLVLSEGRVAANGPPPEVLTPPLLRQVFRMAAEVRPGPPPSVHFLAPAPPP